MYTFLIYIWLEGIEAFSVILLEHWMRGGGEFSYELMYIVNIWGNLHNIIHGNFIKNLWQFI